MPPFRFIGICTIALLFKWIYGIYLILYKELYFHNSPLAVGHLWFVLSLLAYSIILPFLVNYIPKEAKPFNKFYLFLLFALMCIFNLILRSKYSLNHRETWIIPVEVAHIPNYFLAFIAGYYVNQQKWLEYLDGKLSLLYLPLLMVGIVGKEFMPTLYSRIYFEGSIFISLSLSLIYFFRKINLNNKRYLQVLSENTYGAYLVHLTIVLAFQYAIIDLPLSGASKFFLLSFLCFFVSMGVSYLLRTFTPLKKII